MMTVNKLRKYLDQFDGGLDKEVAIATHDEEGTVTLYDINMITENHNEDTIVLEFNPNCSELE